MKHWVASIGLEPSAYGASKAGVMHFAETLRADLDPRHFKIQVVNPGFIKTRLTDKNDFSMPFIMTTEDAGKRVVRAMRGSTFSTLFPRRFALLFKFARLLPNWAYFWFVNR